MFESTTPQTSADNDRYLDSGAVRRRYSDATAMTIWRWMKDPQIAFPQPVKLGNRANFWWLPDLIAWDQRRREASKPGEPLRRAGLGRPKRSITDQSAQFGPIETAPMAAASL